MVAPSKERERRKSFALEIIGYTLLPYTHILALAGMSVCIAEMGDGAYARGGIRPFLDNRRLITSFAPGTMEIRGNHQYLRNKSDAVMLLSRFQICSLLGAPNLIKNRFAVCCVPFSLSKQRGDVVALECWHMASSGGAFPPLYTRDRRQMRAHLPGTAENELASNITVTTTTVQQQQHVYGAATATTITTVYFCAADIKAFAVQTASSRR